MVRTQQVVLLSLIGVHRQLVQTLKRVGSRFTDRNPPVVVTIARPPSLVCSREEPRGDMVVRGQGSRTIAVDVTFLEVGLEDRARVTPFQEPGFIAQRTI